MLDKNKINEFVKNVMESMPEGLKNLPNDMKKNLRSAIQATFSKMDLVTREEFDAQCKVLERSREKLEALEQNITELENKTS